MAMLRRVIARGMSGIQARFASTLVVADHNGSQLTSATRSAVAAAKQLGGDVTVLVAADSDAVANQAKKLGGVSKVLFANDASFKGLIAESLTPLVLGIQQQHNFSHIVAGATSIGKNILPRVAAKLDVAMLSDISAIEEENTFIRPIYAGNALSKVRSKDAVKVVTVRATSFAPVEEDGDAPIENVDASGAAQDLTKFVGQELTKSDRPQLDGASIVVSGGRALKSSENFELMYQLADSMGAAVGASRAAVDAGYCPNDLQVGQTGKIVAPQLYLAVGISGAIQHLAGMKDSKVIACINKDPEAPIFQVSDYGLVDDLFKAVPELMEEVKK